MMSQFSPLEPNVTIGAEGPHIVSVPYGVTGPADSPALPHLRPAAFSCQRSPLCPCISALGLQVLGRPGNASDGPAGWKIIHALGSFKEERVAHMFLLDFPRRKPGDKNSNARYSLQR